MKYLGHIISHEGVKVDLNKIKSSTEWNIPTTIKHVRGFLGLTVYYHEFFKNYWGISTPLTSLLKKGRPK